MVSKCILCGNDKLKFKALVLISPWIRQLVNVKSYFSKYFECNSCNSGFFTYRYSKLEMGKIYSGYRQVNYFKIRNRWEKWYSLEYNFNENLEDFAENRKMLINKFILQFISKKIKNVLDYGGDKGQYIPDFNVNASKFVFDLSNQILVKNVTRISNLDNKVFDLIIYAHVLEHVSNPISDINNLLQHCNYLYIEVPFGKPQVNFFRKYNPLIFVYFLASLSPYFYSRLTKPSTGRNVSKFSVLRQSEHINFFTEKSLHEIARVVNCKIVTQVSKIPTPDGVTSQVLQCLFIKN